jgi:hypothetical protein
MSPQRIESNHQQSSSDDDIFGSDFCVRSFEALSLGASTTTAEMDSISTLSCTDIIDAPVGNVSLKFLHVNNNVTDVYKIVQKVTGALGGNGYNGAIYGELTTRSMQRVLNILIDKCQLSSSSRFIDVGSGLGKLSYKLRLINTLIVF